MAACACFNPRPPSLTGEPLVAAKEREACGFQSTPAIADGRTPVFSTWPAATPGFNPRPPSLTGEQRLRVLCGDDRMKRIGRGAFALGEQYHEARAMSKTLLPSFLSCLRGSEPPAQSMRHRQAFLSCLCGSEQYNHDREKFREFLSCLCGSEHEHKQPTQRWRLSELPMRQ